RLRFARPPGIRCDDGEAHWHATDRAQKAERTRGGKEQSPRKGRPRSPTPRPKRDVRSTAERAGGIGATSESGVEPAGQSVACDYGPVVGAADGGHQLGSNM